VPVNLRVTAEVGKVTPIDLSTVPDSTLGVSTFSLKTSPSFDVIIEGKTILISYPEIIEDSTEETSLEDLVVPELEEEAQDALTDIGLKYKELLERVEEVEEWEEQTE